MNEKIEKVLTSIKENPGKTVAIVAGIAVATFVVVKAVQYAGSSEVMDMTMEISEPAVSV